MMIALEGGKTWSLAAIPLLIGCVLLVAGLRENSGRKVR